MHHALRRTALIVAAGAAGAAAGTAGARTDNKKAGIEKNAIPDARLFCFATQKKTATAFRGIIGA